MRILSLVLRAQSFAESHGISAAIEVSLADIREGPTTSNDFRDCANRRFATATAMFEDAIEVVIWGSRPG
jgi:hypothetical protein